MMSLKCFSITSELPVSGLKCTKKWFFLRKRLQVSEKCLPLQPQSREKATKQKLNGALVQLVRIHACHAWGHGFESRTHRESSDSVRNRSFFITGTTSFLSSVHGWSSPFEPLILNRFSEDSLAWRILLSDTVFFLCVMLLVILLSFCLYFICFPDWYVFRFG